MKNAALVLLVLAAGTLVAEDSPLVAAAKSRKAAKQKSKVLITNETLAKSGGHISTTASQPPIALPKEAPKAEPQPQVKTVGTEAAQTEKPKAQAAPPRQIDDAADMLRELDVPDPNYGTWPPIHDIPKDKIGNTQHSQNTSTPQQSQKPQEKPQ